MSEEEKNEEVDAQTMNQEELNTDSEEQEEKDMVQELKNQNRDIIVKEKEYEIEPKKILMVNYDGSYPLSQEELNRLMDDIQKVVNDHDDDFTNRIIMLPSGFELNDISENDFINIWVSQEDDKTVQSVIDSLETYLENKGE